jgi:beta-galactosidase
MAEQWFALGLDSLARSVENVEIESQGDREAVVLVKTELKNSEGSTAFRSGFQYRFSADGGVWITHTIQPEGEMPDWLGRVGVSAVLDRSLNRLTWFGRGPFETWPDRKSGAKTGRYSSLVERLYEPYLIPQDYGNRTDVRWGTLSGDDGVGLFFAGSELLNVSAQDFPTDNLYRAEYPYQLKKGEGITLNLDHAVTGVGCTAIKTLEPYRVLPKRYKYTIYLEPFDSRETPPEALFKARVARPSRP